MAYVNKYTVGLATLLLLVLIFIGAKNHYIDEGYSRATSEYTAIIAKANEEHLKRIHKLEQEAEVQYEINNHSYESSELYTDSVVNSVIADLNRLHNKIDSNGNKVTNSSQSTKVLNARLKKYRNLLKECTAEYTEMGQTADRLNNQLQAFQNYGLIIKQYNAEAIK